MTLSSECFLWWSEGVKEWWYELSELWQSGLPFIPTDWWSKLPNLSKHSQYNPPSVVMMCTVVQCFYNNIRGISLGNLVSKMPKEPDTPSIEEDRATDGKEATCLNKFHHGYQQTLSNLRQCRLAEGKRYILSPKRSEYFEMFHYICLGAMHSWFSFHKASARTMSLIWC